MKKLLLLLILTAVFITGCSQQKNTPTQDFGGQIQAQDGLLYDFGSIDINGGVATKTFKFKNTDTKPLIIYKVSTSCGCTTGIIKVESLEHGPFGMGISNSNNIIIPPETDFSIDIYYDPLFHGPNDLGIRQRTLYFTSSAEENNETVFKNSSNQNLTRIDVRGEVINLKKNNND